MKKFLFIIPLLCMGLISCGGNSFSSFLSETSNPSSISKDTTNASTTNISDWQSTNTTSNLKKTTITNPMKIVDKNNKEYFVTIADPDMIYGNDGYWYLYCTNCECEMSDKGKKFDLGPIFRSNDFLSWKWCGSVFSGQEDAISWGSKGAGVWAPSVIQIGNTYNYYYSLSTWGDANPGIGVATSLTPYGPWEHHGKIIDSKMTGINNSIDPQVLIDDDKVYLVWGSFCGIAITQLTDDGLEPFYASYVKEYTHTIIPTTDGKWSDNNFEGSYIFKKDGFYYYMGSQGSCLDGLSSTYNVKVGKADNLFGPYYFDEKLTLTDEPYGKQVVQPSENVAGTGHNSIIQDFAGDYWIVYHGFDHESERIERELFIDKLLWDDNGYPYVKDFIPSYKETIDGPVSVNI